VDNIEVLHAGGTTLSTAADSLVSKTPNPFS